MDTFDILLKTSITALRLLVYLTVFKYSEEIKKKALEQLSDFQSGRTGSREFQNKQVIREGIRKLWWGSKKASVLLLVAKTMERDAKE